MHLSVAAQSFHPLCLVSFSPVPSISWRRVDGSPFPRKVDARKASGVLEIPYFQQEDTGTYECVAENPRGMNTVKGKLSFYGRSSDTGWRGWGKGRCGSGGGLGSIVRG